MKIIAMYLPQFHRVKENDEWWGEGFTEWDAVKRAKKLCDGQNQPRVPYNDYYYNLLDKDTMKWQSELMHEYGIDGMCIYHYWFKDGRQILEKPAENLLKWKDIDMPFCFCWANETWARSWSNISGFKNAWADTFENEGERDNLDDNGILLLQDYGGEQDWVSHIEYMLKFFEDDRYIKIDGKPVILIYRVSEIDCLYEMIKCWKKRIQESGFPGLYIIGGSCNRNMSSVLDGQLFLEPKNSIAKLKRNKYENIFKYEEVWEQLLKTKKQFGMQSYFGGFVRYDDSPRRGSRGSIIKNDTPDCFEKNLISLLKKNLAHGSDMVFINAWNEWGEGMYLEPDKTHGFKYLEAVKKAKNEILECKVNEVEEYCEGYDENEEYIKRINANLIVLSNWLKIFERNYSLADYVKDKFGSHVALYGFGVLGRHFYFECVNNDIVIDYVVDRKSNNLVVDSKLYNPKDDFPDGEIVVVSAISDFDSIYEILSNKGNYTIVSLGDIIENCLRERESI